MIGRLAATALLALMLLTGCGDDPERASQDSSLPPAPDGVADGCREATDVAACPPRS
jgi:hypothetical protein